jgi:hypothetical protein
MDWNIQCDTQAALTVFNQAQPIMVTLPATLTAHIRGRDLPRLTASGPLGALLARQTQAHASDHNIVALGQAHPALPDDLLNFHYDPSPAPSPSAGQAPRSARPACERSSMTAEPYGSNRTAAAVQHES